jgi:hypothetical protein
MAPELGIWPDMHTAGISGKTLRERGGCGGSKGSNEASHSLRAALAIYMYILIRYIFL